jgi:hypothetical protein
VNASGGGAFNQRRRRTVVAYQSTLRCESQSGSNGDCLDDAHSAILEELRRQCDQVLGRQLESLQGTDTAFTWRFDSDPLTIITVEEKNPPPEAPFAIRSAWEDPDVTHRRWQMDAGAQVAASTTYLSTRLTCSVLAGDDSIPRFVPRFVRSLADEGILFDGPLQIQRRARQISTISDVRDFVSTMSDRSRRLPIVVVSEPSVVDMTALEEALYAAAHVFTIAVGMTFALSDLIGRDYSVFGGAVRIYGSPFDPTDSPYAHPLVLARVLNTHEDGGLRTVVERAYRQSVTLANTLPDDDHPLDVDGLIAAFRGRRQPPPPVLSAIVKPQLPLVIKQKDTPTEAPPPPTESLDRPPSLEPQQAPQEEIEDLKARVADLDQELARKNFEIEGLRAETAGLQAQLAERDQELTRQENQMTSLLEEYFQLKDELAAASSAPGRQAEDPLGTIKSKPLRGILLSVQTILTELQSADSDFMTLDEERAAARRQLFSAQQRLQSLQGDASDTPVQPHYPDALTFASVQNWIDENYAADLVLHPRAQRALDKHVYGDPGKAYRALKILATTYRAMRLRSVEDAESREAFQQACKDEGLILSPAISETSFGQFANDYTVEYEGRRRRIDMHLKTQAKTYDPTRVLRVYFFWDEQKNVCVICHLPSHLDTSNS